MSRRRLTEGCLHALRILAPDPSALHPIYNRTVALNLRVVETVFPEYVRIVPMPVRGPNGERPHFAAMITASGLAHVTPRKTRKAREVRQ